MDPTYATEINEHVHGHLFFSFFLKVLKKFTLTLFFFVNSSSIHNVNVNDHTLVYMLYKNVCAILLIEIWIVFLYNGSIKMHVRCMISISRSLFLTYHTSFVMKKIITKPYFI